MKKLFLILLMILVLTGTAFATSPEGNGGDATATATANIGSGNTLNGQGGTISVLSPSATGGNASIGNVNGGAGGAGGAGGSVTNSQIGGTFAPTFAPTNTNTIAKDAIKNTNTNINTDIFAPSYDPKNTNVNVNKPVNIVDTDITNVNKQGQNQSNTNTFNPTNTQGQDQSQSQKQKQQQNQGQGQGQSQNNAQTIAPNQEVNITNPSKLAVGSAPGVADSELNFISPNERDVQTLLPRFGCDTVKPITVSDCIVDILWQSNDIKFKDLYREVLKGLKRDAVKKYGAKAVRYQIREAASTKTWTTGGELAANAVGIVGSTVAGGTGGVFPKVGRSKSSNLYTVIFLLVQDLKR